MDRQRLQPYLLDVPEVGVASQDGLNQIGYMDRSPRGSSWLVYQLAAVLKFSVTEVEASSTSTKAPNQTAWEGGDLNGRYQGEVGYIAAAGFIVSLTIIIFTVTGVYLLRRRAQDAHKE